MGKCLAVLAVPSSDRGSLCAFRISDLATSSETMLWPRDGIKNVVNESLIGEDVRCQAYKGLYSRCSGSDFIQEFLVSSVIGW